MRILQGSINEKRYICQNDSLVCTSDLTFSTGEETFIEDKLGYHKVGNAGNELAISMHLYSPPFEQCRIWMDEGDGRKSSTSCMCNFSEYGKRV